MARWLREYAAILTVAIGLVGTIAGLWIKAALADTDKRVTVLETLRTEDAKSIAEIKADVKEILREVRNR